MQVGHFCPTQDRRPRAADLQENGIFNGLVSGDLRSGAAGRLKRWEHAGAVLDSRSPIADLGDRFRGNDGISHRADYGSFDAAYPSFAFFRASMISSASA